MSISNFQEKFIKGGCGAAVLIFCAAVMFGGMFYSCALSNSHDNPNAPTAKTALTVSGTPVSAEVIRVGIDSQMQRYGAMAGQLPASFEAMAYGQVIEQLVDSAAMLPIAQKNGVDLSDASLIKAAEAQIDQDFGVQREQAEMTKQLKPNATDKDWEDYFKKQTGKTPAEAKKLTMDSIRERLGNPEQKQSALISLARPALEQHLARKFTLTDDQLRKTFENVTYKRILFAANTPAAKTESVLKEIQGGRSFEAAIDRYSTDRPTPNKKLSETTNTVTGDTLASEAQWKPIADLKPGQISGVVTLPEGQAIIKVVARTANVPKDFDQKKADYGRKAVAKLVRADVDRQLKEFKEKGDLVKFVAPGFKALWDYQRLMAANPAGPDPAKTKQVYEEAKLAVQKNEGYDSRAAALAQYAALDTLYNAPNTDKKVLRQDRIDSITSLLAETESFKLRMELADLYVEGKQNDEAVEQLLLAAQSNSSTEDQGLQQFREIGGKVLEYKGKGILTAEKEKEILAEQARWSTDKAEADKIAADLKKQEEEDRKRMEAEEKAKKSESSTKTTPPASTTTTGSTPTPATTGGKPK